METICPSCLGDKQVIKYIRYVSYLDKCEECNGTGTIHALGIIDINDNDEVVEEDNDEYAEREYPPLDPKED